MTDYLDILRSPIEAEAWANYMHRPGIVFSVVLAVVVFVIVFAGIRGVTESVGRKRVGDAWDVYASRATYIATAIAMFLAVVVAYTAPVRN